MKLRLIAAAAALLTVTACGETDVEAQQEKHLKARKGAVNVEFNDAAAAKEIVGFRTSSITTVIDSDASSSSGQKTQQVKADCRIKSKGYSVAFRTPERINLPSFGRETPPLDMTCKYKDKTFSEKMYPQNLSKNSRTSNSITVGILLCPVCGVAAGVAGSSDKTTDAYGFDMIEMKLK